LSRARIRGLIVVLWRAGLRIRGARSLRARSRPARWCAACPARQGGAADARSGWTTEVWEHLTPWTPKRLELPLDPLFCIAHGPARGRPWPQTGARSQLRRLAARAGVRRRFAPPPAPPRPRRRDGARGCAPERDPASARPRQPRRHIDLPAGDRQRRDHQHDPQQQTADDARNRRAEAVTATRGYSFGVPLGLLEQVKLGACIPGRHRRRFEPFMVEQSRSPVTIASASAVRARATR